MDRTIVLRGPFVDHEIRALWYVLQTIERERPAERFKMIVDAGGLSDSIEDAMQLLDSLAPLAEGYARVIGAQKNPGRGRG